MSYSALPVATNAGAAGAATPPSRSRRIVDAPIRSFHALFALCFTGAYLTAEGEALRLLHVTLGYTLAGLLAFRVVYGLVGPRQARLALLWQKLAAAPQWLASVRQVVMERPPAPAAAVNWRQGQNLLLALAVLALLVLVVPLTVSGYGTYNEWGDWLGDVHELIGNTFLGVVLAHIGIIILISVLRGKNMAAPMVSGRTKGLGPDLVKRNHAWLAVLMLVAVLAYWSWEWNQSPKGLISLQAVGDLMRGQKADQADDD